MRTLAVAVVVTLAAARAAPAHGQSVDRRYAQEPTGGVALPTTPLAGEQDSRAVVINPGGLPLVRGADLTAALDLEDSSVADSSGPGFGLYGALPFGGHWIPRMAIGMGFEWLRPAQAALAPDPGSPFRFTAAYGLGLGANAGIGVSWHHFSDQGALGGLDTFDAGASARLGNYLAVGATVLDINTGIVAGTPVQRRYQLELVGRPLGSAQLELAVGGRLGETRLDTDGWARADWRVVRGLTLHAQLDSRDVFLLETSPAGVRDEVDGRDVRATVGVELSFGKLGLAAYGSGVRTNTGADHLLGGTIVARASAVGPRSILGPIDHIARVDLTGNLGVREVTQLVLRFRAIARDPSAKAVVVTFDDPRAGWGALQELRGELLALRRAHKPVFAYMVAGGSREYFVASAADKIYMDPGGLLRLNGLSGTTMFFRGAFDLVGIQPQFEKIGEYKSAPEEYTEIGPTEIASAMTNAMFDSVWDEWLSSIAAGRGLIPDRVKAIVDHGSLSAGDLATSHELVDAVASSDKISALITHELGAAYPVDEPPTTTPERWQRPGIAVIYVDGNITSGTSRSIPVLGEKLSGGDSVIAAIEAARASPRVAAIVLRIDSPGGGSLASELISREVFATRGIKPIVCSMSNVAASGGYFIAAGCDVIYAEPMTITGSIGIFAGKFDISGLAKKLGIATTIYRRGAHADADSMFRPYTDAERQTLLDNLRYAYGRFLGAVAEGRKLTRAEVDGLGRGHVYTGAQAKPLHLVDTLGGLGAALDDVEKRLGYTDDRAVAIIELPTISQTVLGWVAGQIGALAGTTAADPLGLSALPAVRELLRGIPASVLVAPDVPQARLPFDLVWE